MKLFDGNELYVVQNLINDLLLYMQYGDVALNDFLKTCIQIENSGDYRNISSRGVNIKIADDNLNGGLFIDTKSFNCMVNFRIKDLTLFTPYGHFVSNRDKFGYMNDIEACYLKKASMNDIRYLFFNYVYGELVYLHFSES